MVRLLALLLVSLSLVGCSGLTGSSSPGESAENTATTLPATIPADLVVPSGVIADVIDTVETFQVFFEVEVDLPGSVAYYQRLEGWTFEELSASPEVTVARVTRPGYVVDLAFSPQAERTSVVVTGLRQ